MVASKRIPNRTIPADDAVLRWARLRAAEGNTSVARLVGDLLKEHMQEERGYENAKRRFLGTKARVLSKARKLTPSGATT